MSYLKTTHILLLTSLSMAFFLIWLSKETFGSVATVQSTVRIHVCGDGVVEFPESCEPSQDAVVSCSRFGFNSGVVGCDNSCEFDVLGCFNFIPDLSDEKIEIINSLPIILKTFDLDSDGVLKAEELVVAVVQWLTTWRDISLSPQPKVVEVGACDVNRDRACDLIDFSILLYYSR